MQRLGLILVSFVLVCCTCFGQQTIGPTSREIADFAFELSIYPADRRAEMVAAHPERLTVVSRKELIALGNVRFTASEYTKALDIYQLAEKISEQIGDKEGVATAQLNLGSVYFLQNNYEPALDQYRKAETLFLSLNNRFEAARCHFGIVLTFQAQRKQADALMYQEALREFESAGDRTCALCSARIVQLSSTPSRKTGSFSLW